MNKPTENHIYENKQGPPTRNALCNRHNRLITPDPQGGYLSASWRNSDASVCDRLIAAHRQERSNTFVRCAGIAALCIGICAARAADLPRPGDAIDAGDSYGLKDGSRVALHRLVNEAAVKHTRSKSVEPIVRQAGINAAPLVTIENGKSHIVDLYYSEDSQAVADLMNVQEEGVAVFPVLINPTSRRRMIATDEIIVQFAIGIGGPQAVGLPWLTHFQFSSEPFGGVYSPPGIRS